MEKAKLTREQERVLKSAIITRQPANLVQEYAKAPGFFNAAYGSSGFMDLDTLCRALYVGYEIVEDEQTVVVTAEMLDDIRIAIEICTRDGDFIWNQGAEYVLKKLGIKL